tara:strand:+ start:172 stop:744 length:573 start_codon:yes stop_codon:yes gene_type:complete
MTKVKVYTANEQTIAVRILLLAFSSDPWKRYLMPDPSTYIKNSTLWFENAVRQSIESKTLFGTDDKSGIATWFKPNYELEFEEIEETFKELPKEHEKDIFQYFKEFEKNKPKDAWYLEYLGVDPARTSLGLGSFLLKHSLAEIDNLRQAAYLESSNPRNMSLYKRHGFETLTKIQFGEGPPMHTMYREAR